MRPNALSAACSGFVRGAAAMLALAVPLTVTTEARAQNLGNIYGNLYFQTHSAMNLLNMAGGGSSGGSSRRRRSTTSPTWNMGAKSSNVIQRMVKSVPPASRAATRAELTKMLANYPTVVKALSKATGVSLNPRDARDSTVIASALCWEELTGKDLSTAQFQAQKDSIHRWFANNTVSRATIQASGENYSMALMLTATLKQWEDNPKNPNKDLTRQQVRQIAADTFRTVFGTKSTDYNTWVATSRGIHKQ